MRHGSPTCALSPSLDAINLSFFENKKITCSKCWKFNLLFLSLKTEKSLKPAPESTKTKTTIIEGGNSSLQRWSGGRRFFPQKFFNEYSTAWWNLCQSNCQQIDQRKNKYIVYKRYVNYYGRENLVQTSPKIRNWNKLLDLIRRVVFLLFW